MRTVYGCAKSAQTGGVHPNVKNFVIIDLLYENLKHVKLRKENIEKHFAKECSKCLFKITNKVGAWK